MRRKTGSNARRQIESRPKTKKRPDRENRNEIKPVEAKTENQKNYIIKIAENDIVFCCGPAGSGKSFIAAGIAAEHLHRGKIENIIITRPLVCAGKDIGSLPGELMEKIDPYLIPMQENFKFFLGQAYYGHYYREKKISYQPLEVMRGATYHNTYMILDEAQNCTFEQIKMFITRMGQGSKVLINGDIKQSDIRNKSGLEECIKRLDGVNGVGISKLDQSDIQRNGIIGKVLTALES
jgi:phosphate starvation-inducible PhoH-like protein